jgi:hypothetical protein
VLEEAKEVKRTWAEIRATQGIEYGGGFLWMPYVPQRNDGTIDDDRVRDYFLELSLKMSL